MILQVLISIVLVGVIVWAVNRYIPMQPTIKQIFNVVAIILLCLWLLQVFGVFSLGSMRL